MKYYVAIRGATFEVDIDANGTRVDGKAVEASAVQVAGTDVHSLLVDGASYRFVANSPAKGEWNLHVRGRHERVEVLDEHAKLIQKMSAARAGPPGPKALKAPMPGLVVKVEVEEGDLVEVGTGLLIVEAMKMENELVAEAPARIGGVHVVPGQAVEKGQLLMDMLPIDPSENAT
jgi:biotin carboxyl carrier protein